MNRHLDLDEKGVKARLADGQLPVLDSSYSFKSLFQDGAEASHQVMSRIVHAGLLDVPKSRGQAWTPADQKITESST